MTTLTDTQLIVLSSAMQREDGALVPPKDLKGGAAANVVKPLLRKKLVKEVRATQDMPVWRRDEERGRSVALIITRAGRDAINAEGQTHNPEDAERGTDDETESRNRRRTRKTKTSVQNHKSALGPPASSDAMQTPRSGSKLALVVKLLGRVCGASIDDLTAATDWLPHTTRAVITSLRNKGYRIETERNADSKTVYRIVVAEHSASPCEAA